MLEGDSERENENIWKKSKRGEMFIELEFCWLTSPIHSSQSSLAIKWRLRITLLCQTTKAHISVFEGLLYSGMFVNFTQTTIATSKRPLVEFSFKTGDPISHQAGHGQGPLSQTITENDRNSTQPSHKSVAVDKAESASST